MILIKYNGKQILLECGMCQSNDYLESYKLNSRKFGFEASDIDYVFVCHQHIDHIGLLPLLIKRGFKGKIIATTAASIIMKPLLENCAFIVKSEASTLSRKYKREYDPLYSECDVNAVFNHVYEYNESHIKYVLDDVVSFEWLDNSHCVGAKQLRLTLTNAMGVSESILYTSDIGALHTENHYVVNTEIDERPTKMVIMESTYGDGKRQNKKRRYYDIEHLRVACDTVLERGGTVIMPCFSFSRTQEILTTLYDIYGEDKFFTYDIVVDSVLSCEISKLYGSLLSGEDLKLWDKVRNWKNVQFISDKETSLACVKSHKPKISISSSGFCTNGRVLSYLHEYLKDLNSMVVFSGFTGADNSYLSYRIKNYKENKYISISGDKVLNDADCISLSTFSSHANRNDLITFGSKQNTEKLILVHGSSESKNSLKSTLMDAISKEDKSFKVLCSSKDMYVKL